MTRIKICGPTAPLDPSWLDGVDLVGLNFVRESRRRVDVATAVRIADALPARIQVVAVFADPSLDEVAAVRDALRVDFIQLHGHESPAQCRRFGVPFIKAFRAERAAALIAAIPDYRDSDDHPYLVDAATSGALGGTGVLVDVALARAVNEALGGSMILAGGLRPENVYNAIEQARPWAVDVASGVESAPGIKDPKRIADFVEAVRGPHV